MSTSEFPGLPVPPGEPESSEELESSGEPESPGEPEPPGEPLPLDQPEKLVPPDQPVPPEQPPPEPLLTASPEAINFLASIMPEELQMILFTDSLVTFSDTGKELGEFTITIQSILHGGEPCLSIHANSHGSIDNIPCGTSISAYISNDLETLEQHHHEYVKLKDQPLVKKTHMVKHQDRFVVRRTVTVGENLKSQSLTFELTDMRGFVSEACNLVLLRVLSRRNKVPDDMVFLSFDTEMQLSTSTYFKLGHRTMKIGREEQKVFGIQRTIHSDENGPMSWHCSFLSDGHLASRLQVGSPITMMVTQIPHLIETEEEEPKPVFEKKSLNWEEDMQLYFRFIDRTEALKADYSSYIRNHPELRCLLADFLQFLLLRKPQDVITFTAEYFASFSTLNVDQVPFLTTKSNPFKEPH